MSTQQQNELVKAVLREIESQSHSIDELQTVNSLDGISSLPVKRNDDIVLVPLSLLTSSSNGIMPFQTSNPNDYSSSTNLKDYTDAKGGVIHYCSHANALRFYYIYNNAPYKRWYNSSLYNDESVGGTDKARTDTIFYNIQDKSLHIVKSGKFLEINGLLQTTGTSDYYPMSQKAVTTALEILSAEDDSINKNLQQTQRTKQDKETVIVYDETELPDIVSLYTNQRIIVKNPIERDFVLSVRGNSCFDFMTGNSIPIIAFMPANIQWIKPLELKPNKRYLILFDRAIQEEPYYNTNIVGMWTEVDIETSQITEE